MTTWNCNMAFRNKASFIIALQPDIVIVPECEHPDRLKFKPGTLLPTNIIWSGKNLNKGLGIFSYSDYKFQLHDSYQPDFRNIVPLKVTGGKIDFILFAIWANNPADKGYQYIGQIWKALNYYEGLLSDQKIILAGDFNSNSIWDKLRREGNHSTVVAILESKRIYSTYHKFFNQEQGKEKHNTLYMYRHPDKAYHIDYCFASTDFVEKIVNVEIGVHKKWAKHSDHIPLTVTFNI
ncbi:MAG TPA: endonuclease/exonuclease/phosphatase family protein [Chitinophagaceae bacterium]